MHLLLSAVRTVVVVWCSWLALQCNMTDSHSDTPDLLHSCGKGPWPDGNLCSARCVLQPVRTVHSLRGSAVSHKHQSLPRDAQV